MLRVNRAQVQPPRVLAPEVTVDLRRAITDYLRLPGPARAQRRAQVDTRLMRSPDVIAALRTLFRDKCAFCESAVPHGEERLEHFRPLSSARDLAGNEMRDHYLWLAYEWDNLMLACETCSKAKANLFPVEGYRARSRATMDEVWASEVPEIVDPTRMDPAVDIAMRADGTCRPLRRRGEVTIAVLQLNRSRLVQRRSGDAEELRVRVGEALRRRDAERLSLMFSLSREYVGTRLDLLHRALLRWVPTGTRLPSARAALPGALARMLQDASDDDIGVLADAFERVFVEDLALAPPVAALPGELAAGGRGRPPRRPGLAIRDFPDRQIRSIDIHDYKGIERLSFTIERRSERLYEVPCLMLLGENSAGKSSILEAVALALLGTRGIPGLRIPGSAFLRRDHPDHFDLVDPRPPRVEVGFTDGEEPAVLSISADGRTLEGTPRPSVLVLAYGARRAFAGPRPSVDRNPYLVRNLFRPDIPLPAVEPWLQELGGAGATFDAVARALREILALDPEDELVVDEAGRPSVRVMGRVIPVERLSEGYRSLFSLAVDIMRNLLASWDDLERARAVVLIDEIETHLHPRWKMRVVSALRRAFPGVQFLVTTHDPLCLRGMDEGEVEVVERDRDGAVHRLEDLPSVRGMTAEQLLTSEYFGLSSTADPELELGLARLGEGEPSLSDRARDDDLVARVVLGDTVKQQLVHEAVDRYLEERERRRGQGRARREAVEAVLEVLRADRSGEAAG